MAIIKRNNGKLYTKNDIDVVYITEHEKKVFQHTLSNFGKKILKTKTDKGPDNVKVSLVENMAIFTCEKYMTKYEKYVFDMEDENADILHRARVKTNNSFVEDNYEIDDFVFELLGAKVLGYLYDVCLEEDFALWVILLDKNIVCVKN